MPILGTVNHVTLKRHFGRNIGRGCATPLAHGIVRDMLSEIEVGVLRGFLTPAAG